MCKRTLYTGAAAVIAAFAMLILGATGPAAAKRLPVKRIAANRLRPLPLPSGLPAPLPDPSELLTPSPTPRPTPTPTPAVVEAAFTWSLASRVELYRRGRAFDAETRTYDPGYIYPTGFHVNFDACESSGGEHPIHQYTWHIEGIDVAGFSRTISTDSCRFNHAPPPKPPIPRECLLDPEATCDIDLEDWPEAPPSPPLLPSQGRYRVTLTVRNAAWETAKVSQEVAVKDWLIVSVGDSNASGEGNPDLPADWDAGLGGIDVSDPIWEDPACNRSRISGPALAAAIIEHNDPHSTVTFLSFACSGAELADIMLQVDAARELICGDADDCRDDARPVDALFISGGVNDLGFASVIKGCASLDEDDIDGSILEYLFPYERAAAACDDHLDAMVNGALFGLYASYGQLNEHIAALGPDEVYITEYPTEVFTDDDGDPEGCGVFNDISDQEAAWLIKRAEDLNFEILMAANAFRWNYVGGIAEAFKGHGYCADDYWFVELNESLSDQLGIKGAIHPTYDGHMATAGRIVDVFSDPKPDQTRIREVTVTFEQVRVVNERTQTHDFEPTGANVDQGPSLDVSLTAYLDRRPREASRKDLTTTTSEWIDLPADEYSFTIEVAEADAVHVRGQTQLPAVYGLHPKTFEPIIRKPAEPLIINRTYGRDVNYGEGSHEESATHLDGSITVRYRIDVEPILPVIRPSFPVEEVEQPAQVAR